MAHSPNGRFVVTTHEDTSIRLRDAATAKLIKLLKGHNDVVSAVAFSPDSQTLATGSYDQTIKLWNLETAELMRTLKGHGNWVFSVAFSPDGKTLASGGYDKSIRLWNVADGEPKGVLEGHTAAVRSLAFSPDGKQLVSGSSDRTVQIWDLETQKSVKELKGHTAAVRAVAFSPDGTKIASGSEDKTIRYWNPATGESQQELKGHTGMVWCLAFSPRGRTLASAGFDNSLRIWNGENGAALQTLTGHQDVVTSLSYAPDSSAILTGSYDKTLKLWTALEPPIPALADLNLGDGSDSPLVRFVVFAPDGTRMMTGNQNRSIRLWDLETGRMMKTVLQPRGISNGALSPDGKLLVTTDFGGKAYFWNAETLESIDTLETGQSQGTVVAFSPDGKLLSTGDWNGEVKIWNALTREKIGELPKQEMPVTGFAFSPDGKLAATTTGNYKASNKAGTVKLWDTKTWKEIANLPGPTQNMRPLAFNPDGRTLIAGGSQHELLVYDVPNKKLAAHVPMDTEVTAVEFLPDSRTIVIGRYDGKVELWNVPSRQRIANYAGHTQAANQNSRLVFDVGVSADGSVVASAGADGHVKLWPTSAQPPLKPLASLEIKDAEPFGVAFSPDGSRLAIATTAKVIEIRETKTGNVLHTIGPFKSSCVSVSFAPDGQRIAGAAQSGWATVWNAETGEKLFSVEAHPGGARRAVFSPDGLMLATCGWDETAAVWNVADGTLRYRTPPQGLAVSDVKFSPEGKLLLTATGSYKEWQKPGTIKIWKAEDGTSYGQISGHGAEIKGIAFDAGGNFISYGSNGAKVWARMTRKLVRSIGAGTTMTAAELSPDGNDLIAGDRSGRMVVYDVNSGSVKQAFAGHQALVYSVAATPDGTALASSSKDGTVKLWPGSRIAGLVPLAQVVDDPQQSRTIAYSPDGKWLAVGGQRNTITLRDASTFNEVRTLTGHNGMLFRLVFTPDSKSLLSSSSDGTVRLWNVANGRETANWTIHKEKRAHVRGLDVSPDGKQIATSNDNGECRVWDLETREELYHLPNQSQPLTGLAFSPDGQLLATCSGDWQNWETPGKIKLWNAQTGEAVRTLEGHAGEIKGLLFNRDGKTLISYGAFQSLRIWDVADGHLLRKLDFPHNLSAVALFNEETLLIGDVIGSLFLADFQKGFIQRQTRGHYGYVSEIAVAPAEPQFATVSHDGLFKIWSTKPPQPAIRQLPAGKAGDSARLAEKIRVWQPLILGKREANLNGG